MKPFIAFIALALMTLSTRSQNESDMVVFDHVALSVTNVNTSVKFYKNVLNLKEIKNKTEVKGIRWMSLGEGKELHLISVVEGKLQLNKAVHFALKSLDFDAFIENIKKNEIPFSSWDGIENKITTRADGIRQIYIQDPDGYWIEVNSHE